MFYKYVYILYPWRSLILFNLRDFRNKYFTYSIGICYKLVSHAQRPHNIEMKKKTGFFIQREEETNDDDLCSSKSMQKPYSHMFRTQFSNAKLQIYPLQCFTKMTIWMNIMQFICYTITGPRFVDEFCSCFVYISHSVSQAIQSLWISSELFS